MVTRDQRIRESESERGVGDTFQLPHPVSKYHLKGPVQSLNHTALVSVCLSHSGHVTTNYLSKILIPSLPDLITDYLHW